jgi:MYXO-CTERM domain-containing protein
MIEKKMKIAALGLLFTGVVTVNGTAAAHIRMDQPIARNVWATQPGGDPIKNGPCGAMTNDVRTTDPAKINTFEPGETIVVSWKETINHPAHYRISIDMDGQDDFVDPTGPTDIVQPAVLPVLLDGIEDMAGGPGTYSVEVTLPNETCDNCTLQLIQYMHDTNESYYNCADLVIAGEVISGDGDTGTGGDPGTVEPGTGGAATSSGGAVSSGGQATGGTNTGGALGQVPGSGGAPTGSDPIGTTGNDETAGAEEGPSLEQSGCSVAQSPSKNPEPWLWMLAALSWLGVLRRRRSSSLV